MCRTALILEKFNQTLNLLRLIDHALRRGRYIPAKAKLISSSELRLLATGPAELIEEILEQLLVICKLLVAACRATVKLIDASRLLLMTLTESIIAGHVARIHLLESMGELSCQVLPVEVVCAAAADTLSRRI